MRRKLFVLLLGGLAAALVAGCSDDDSEVNDELVASLQALSASVEHLAEEAQSLSERAEAIEMQVIRLDEADSTLGFDAGRVGPSRAPYLPNPPAGLVTVQFLAEDLNATIPGSFDFYIAPEGATLFETGALPGAQLPPVGQQLEDGIVFVEPGVLYKLQVVYHNTTGEDIEFLVPGGILDPQAALPFVRNRCWCAAIPFTAPAGQTFYRTIEVGVGPDTPPGAKALVVWPVVELS